MLYYVVGASKPITRKVDFKLEKYALGVDVDGKTAGNKAQKDINQVAEELGYQTIKYRIAGGRVQQFFSKLGFSIKLRRIPQKSRLLFQYPLAGGLEKHVVNFLEKRGDVELVLFIHDLDILRNAGNDVVIQREVQLLNLAKTVVVHNNSMKVEVEKKILDIKKTRIIVLQLFDYLCEISKKEKSCNKNSVVIAGNLSKNKSGYIYHLSECSAKLNYHLYGINYIEQKKAHIVYHGAFRPEELPDKLEQGFGLVWDGDELSCCSGSFGEYLRYNNPHKLSLYLATGMPVVVWDQAAVKGLVETEGIGLVVSSLSDMEKQIFSLSDEDYCAMRQNAQRIGERVRDGYYAKKVFELLEEGI